MKLIISVIILVLPSLALAEAYSWTDSEGRTIYGTNPPKSGHNVKSVTTRGLSRYSSSKVIDRLGWRGSLINDPIPEIGVIKEGDLPAIEGLPIEEGPASAKLEYNNLKISLDQVNSKIINRCKIEVTNTGSKIANDIAVAFEFRDGTLIPGAGPASLDPGASAVYKIAPDLTPLKLNFGLSRKNPEKSVKVILDMQK